MSDSITPRDLFAAVTLHSLLPSVLEQEQDADMREAVSLVVVCAWDTANAMMQIRDHSFESNEPEA